MYIFLLFKEILDPRSGGSERGFFVFEKHDEHLEEFGILPLSSGLLIIFSQIFNRQMPIKKYKKGAFKMNDTSSMRIHIFAVCEDGSIHKISRHAVTSTKTFRGGCCRIGSIEGHYRCFEDKSGDIRYEMEDYIAPPEIKTLQNYLIGKKDMDLMTIIVHSGAVNKKIVEFLYVCEYPRKYVAPVAYKRITALKVIDIAPERIDEPQLPTGDGEFYEIAAFGIGDDFGKGVLHILTWNFVNDSDQLAEQPKYYTMVTKESQYDT